MSEEEAEYIEVFSDLMRGLILFTFILVFLLIGLGGRLLPTWMFINSMQLIFHAPLLNTYMPANLNYFLL